LTAFGTDRERLQLAEEIQSYVGIAPVTARSGKLCRVRRRYACPKFLCQTFHGFADQARRWSKWSKAYYQLLRNRGKKHHAAVRVSASTKISIWPFASDAPALRVAAICRYATEPTRAPCA
jgi:transposase